MAFLIPKHPPVLPPNPPALKPPAPPPPPLPPNPLPPHPPPVSPPLLPPRPPRPTTTRRVPKPGRKDFIRVGRPAPLAPPLLPPHPPRPPAPKPAPIRKPTMRIAGRNPSERKRRELPPPPRPPRPRLLLHRPKMVRYDFFFQSQSFILFLKQLITDFSSFSFQPSNDHDLRIDFDHRLHRRFHRQQRRR